MHAMNNNIRAVFIRSVKIASPYGCAARGKGLDGEPNFERIIVNGDSRLHAQPSRRICLAICAVCVITLTRRAAVNGVTSNVM